MACAVVALALAGCGGGGDAPPGAPTVQLQVTPTWLQTGESITITWNALNATSCSAAGSWGGPLAVSGSETYVMYEPGYYLFVVQCYGVGGDDTEAAEVEVWGQSYDPDQPVVVFTADPTSAPVGGTTTLSWSTDLGQSCTASGGWSGTKAPSGSETVTVTEAGSNFYGITCHADSGDAFRGVYVTGLQAAVTLAAAPAVAGPGQTTTLTWSSTQASTCTAAGAWSGTKAASGSETIVVPALGENVFSLTCSDPGAAGTQSTTVIGAAPEVRMRAFPPTASVGESVTLYWDAPYALDCTASGAWSGARPASGRHTFTVDAPGALDFGLECSNAGDSAQASAAVTAAEAPALPPATAYQLNARHDGATTFVGGLTLPAQAAPTWSRDFGALVQYPLIADGRAYVVTRNPDGSYGGRLYALDQATGATLWGPIAVSGTYSLVGHAYASGRIFVLNFDGLLRAFDAGNGAALWSTQLPGYWYDSAPTAYGGLVFATGNGGFFALDEATGETLWSGSMRGDHSSPAVTSEGVYTMQVCRVQGFNPVFGTELWTRQGGCSGGGGRNIALRDDRLYVRYYTGPIGNDVWIMDAASGDDLGLLSSRTIPAVTGTTVFTLSSSTLAPKKISDGSQPWTFAGDGQLTSAPVVVNDTVFVGSGSGKVYAVDAATGAERWFGTAPDGVDAPDEHNIMGLNGLAAGEGWLLVPAGNHLAAWKIVE